MKKINLLKKYKIVDKLLSKVDFGSIWSGFYKLPFALYNDKEVCFKGEIIPKTNEFIANTSIKYKGEYIAIWQLNEDLDDEILASKLAHEMFHAFQMINGESRFPNELEAVIKYQYNSKCMSYKYKENILLKELTATFSPDKYNELLRLRRRRYEDFPYEYNYEAQVEQIEGTANYVELEALRQISADKYERKLERMLKSITLTDNLLPVRIVSYDIGALIVKLIKLNGIDCNFAFDQPPFALQIVQCETPCGQSEDIMPVENSINSYFDESKRIVESTLANNDLVVSGDFELLGINVYDARYISGYVVSTYFVAYKDEDVEKFLYGNFVIKLNSQNRVQEIYRIKTEMQ